MLKGLCADTQHHCCEPKAAFSLVYHPGRTNMCWLFLSVYFCKVLTDGLLLLFVQLLPRSKVLFPP